jgi:hypothetical protein
MAYARAQLSQIAWQAVQESSSTTINKADMSADLQLARNFPRVSSIAFITARRQWTTYLSPSEPGFLKWGDKPFTKLENRLSTGTGDDADPKLARTSPKASSIAFVTAKGRCTTYRWLRPSPASSILAASRLRCLSTRYQPGLGCLSSLRTSPPLWSFGGSNSFQQGRP